MAREARPTQRLDGRRVGDVEPTPSPRPPAGPAIAATVGGGVVAARRAHDRGARGAERVGNGAADAARGAGDERHLAGQVVS